MLTLPFVLLVLATFVTLAAVICHLALIPLLRTVSHLAPEPRAHALLLLAMAPWLIGTGVVVSSIADIWFGACDFGTACLWNENPEDVVPIRALVAVPLVVGTLWAAAGLLRQMIAARRVVAALDRLAASPDEQSVRIIPTASAVALAGGGRVYLSQGLLDQLPSEQFRAVILHEQAHLRRHDGLFQGIAQLATAIYLPPFRRRLLAALTLANEQACDEQAASEVGKSATAAAILAVERLSSAQPGALLAAFAQSCVPARVRALVETARHDWNFGLFRTAVVLTVVFAFLGADILYYLGMLILDPMA